MSTAIVSLEGDSLNDQCRWIVQQEENLFGHCAISDCANRTQQLYEIVKRCVLFKHKLECQADTYIFWCSLCRMPFRDEKMRTPNDDQFPCGDIEVSLWPMLSKVVNKGEWVVVEKEMVKILPEVSPLMEFSDEGELDSHDPDSCEL